MNKMTIEEKRNALVEFCHIRLLCDECPLHVPELKCGRGQHFAKGDGMSDEDVNLAYSIAFPEEKSGFQEVMEKIQECNIKDSGIRRQFNTGAVRDIQEGKGRCDLMPLDVVARVLNMGYEADHVLDSIHTFTESADILFLYEAVEAFRNMMGCDMFTLMLELSKHFEEGAKKYGENNWQKGIPTHCYIDSAVRHYLKWLRGDKDEPHDRAFCWNIICCIWTCIHKPELNDYLKLEPVEGKKKIIPRWEYKESEDTEEGP